MIAVRCVVVIETEVALVYIARRSAWSVRLTTASLVMFPFDRLCEVCGALRRHAILHIIRGCDGSTQAKNRTEQDEWATEGIVASEPERGRDRRGRKQPLRRGVGWVC